MAALLLANKAEVNAVATKAGLTPLHVAVFQHHNGVVELLLSNGAKINAKDNDGQTPLHMAAANGHKDVVELLLANRATVNVANKNGKTPLQYAVHYGRWEVAELLSQITR